MLKKGDGAAGAGANDANGGILRSLHFTKTDPLGPSLVTSTHPSPLSSLAGRARKCTTTDGVFDDDKDDDTDGSSVLLLVVVSVDTTMRKSIASERKVVVGVKGAKNRKVSKMR